MRYAHPGSEGAIVSFKARYGNYIGGEFVPPVKGQYFTNTSPVNGQPIAEFPRSTAEDIDKALDAAHAAADAWGRTSVQERSNILLKIADRIEQNLELLAVTETWDNGKAVRETLNADIPLAADHFRYFAGCIRAQEGSAAEINDRTVAYHIHEPLGVVGQIIPWNFPLLMAAWKLAPALAAGNCVVLKPAEQTPLGICVLLELIGDLLPPGVLNVVQGFGREAGEALATSKRIAKIAFTGSTPVGSHILKCAAENIIPSTVELGGKSPNIYFEDIMQAEPAFIEKAAEGLVLAFFNQGEVCTCPSRALVQESIYPAFMEEVLKKVRAIKRGDPLDTETMVGAQASQQQYEKILSYLDIAQQEGAELLAGGSVEKLEGNLASGYYIQPTLLKGHNGMRVFQEEIFGPVVGVTTFKDEAEALAIANDTEYGLGAGLWTRDINRAYRMGRGIKAGRVWTNCYHLYPAHAAFGGYKKSGVGRETHKMMLDHYQQTKNLLVSYDINPLGFFWAGQAVPTKSGGKLLRKSHSERAPLMFNSTCRNRPAPPERIDPMWTKPSFTDLRLGFEVTLYFANR
ncbi:pyrroloquinoline quinone precursor peptide PqqA [Pseudomonas aeruginosa]|uniref:acetaldehyde dehydrogenase ExaC n=7 Tax=Pseudomonas TaxID=286 RepID=UPI001EDEA1B0|nr:pyrroloquinoline quinone precursor peptide PqqA [Pseudomonas aeruginosa]